MSDAPKPPIPRIKRLLDVEPLVETVRALKVRPFEECFDRGSGMAPLVVRGEVEAGAFCVSITGRPRVMLSGALARDGQGTVALLDAQEHALDEHHALRVDADAHDSDGSCAAISYVELTRDAVARRQLEYAERWCSIYFNPAGVVDGTSWGGPQSVRPRARN